MRRSSRCTAVLVLALVLPFSSAGAGPPEGDLLPPPAPVGLAGPAIVPPAPEKVAARDGKAEPVVFPPSSSAPGQEAPAAVKTLPRAAAGREAGEGGKPPVPLPATDPKPSGKPPALQPVTEADPAPGPAPAKPPAFRLIEPERGPPAAVIQTSLVPPAQNVAATDKQVPPSSPQGTISAPKAAGPALDMEKTVPPTLTVGQAFTYEITVRNIGSVEAAQVHVEDVLPLELRFVKAWPTPEYRGNRLAWDLGRMKAGAEWRLSVEVEPVRALESLPGAAVCYTGPESRVVTRPSRAVVAHADLEAQTRPGQETGPISVKVSAPTSAAVGERVVCRVDLTNASEAPLTEVVLRVILPPGLRHPQGNDIEANLGTLTPWHTRNITFPVMAVAQGQQPFRLEVTAQGGLHATATATVGVGGPAGNAMPVLTMDVSNRDKQVEIGAETVYEIRVVNQGTGPASGVQVLALAPEGMQPRGAAGEPAYRITGQQVLFDPLARLEPGAEARFNVRALCQRPGDWRFKVQLTCSEQLRLPLYKEENTRVYNDRN